MNLRKLRLESLEERTLLAVVAGSIETPAELVAPTEAATWVVNTLDDPSTWNTADDLLSLREAVGRAASGDTIVFDSTLAGGVITLSGSQLSVYRGITIDASEIGGITISADDGSRVLYVSGGTKEIPVNLLNLTIAGGQAANSTGGGIYNAGTLALTNCTICGNTAKYGGGIYNAGTVTLTNCTVSGNSANGDGGGIYNSGYRNTVTLANTIVALNYAKYSNDFNSSSSSGSHNIIGADPGFVTAPLFEDGVLVNFNELDLSLTEDSIAIDRGANDAVTAETDLIGNPRIFAAWRDPATVDIGAYEYQGTVDRSTVVTTALDTVDETDGLISLREAISYALPGEMITFDESLAGETIVLNGSQLEIRFGMTIDAASIGGITIDANGQCRVFSISGGDDMDPVQLIGLTITGGQASNSQSGGGGIYNSGTLTVIGSAIVGNVANAGGGVYNSGTLTLTNITVSGNSSSSLGSGIYSYGNRSSLTMTNTIVSQNYAKDNTDFYSGNSFSGSNNIIGFDPGFVAAPVFENGKLVNAGEVDFSLAAESIAIDRGTNDVVTTETDLAGNPRIFASWLEPATVDVGAYEFQETAEQEALSTVMTTNLDILDVADGLVSLREAIIYASLSGEAVAFDESLAGETITLNGTQLEIYQGIAVDAASIGGITIDAGGKSRVFYINTGCKGNPIELTGLIITGGKAEDRDGGGIYIYSGALKVTDSVISGNTANSGGGIYSYGQLTITGSTVSGNTAGFSGGGIYHSGIHNTLTVEDSAISGNTASYGGGISNEDFSILNVTGSFIVGNSAISGGGIDNYESATATVIGSVIAGNVATGGKLCCGGGINNNQSGTLTVTGSTIAGNIAGCGGGIYTDDSGTLSLTNTILSLNSAGDQDNIRDSSDPFSGSNNIVDSDPGFVTAPVFADGKLVNAGELDLALTDESIAIDTGLNDAVTAETDIAGNPRIFAAWREPATVDIGAYEYQNETEHAAEVPSTVVTTPLDLFVETDGLISLREAIFYASSGQTVTFDKSLAGETITLNGSQIEIDKGIAIDASSIGGITIDADGESRAFYINTNDKTNPVELIGLTITGGNAGSRDGGGIYIASGVLKVTDSIISGNSARSGGGICNAGTLTVANSLISANSAGNYGDGGGIYNYNGGTLTVTGSTIAGNSSGPIGYGGGICSRSGSLTMTNTIVALNYTKFYGDLYSTSYSGSSNIVDLDPGFTCAPVFVNGKLTNADELDLSLTEGSIAIDAGENSAVTAEADIAGNPRIVNGVVDIGAYEYQKTETEQLAAPAISTGGSGFYVSCGANRHQLVWTAVENVSAYELQYTDGGNEWASVSAADTVAVVCGLTYGHDVQYRVRALGTGSYTDSDWSEVKVFPVCPMDINGDGDISSSDRVLLISCWLSGEGDDEFLPAADINGDGDISNDDRAFLISNWLCNVKDDSLTYPKLLAAEAVFDDFEPSDLTADLDLF